jgi:hypothetical protein
VHDRARTNPPWTHLDQSGLSNDEACAATRSGYASSRRSRGRNHHRRRGPLHQIEVPGQVSPTTLTAQRRFLLRRLSVVNAGACCSSTAPSSLRTREAERRGERQGSDRSLPTRRRTPPARRCSRRPRRQRCRQGWRHSAAREPAIAASLAGPPGRSTPPEARAEPSGAARRSGRGAQSPAVGRARPPIVDPRGNGAGARGRHGHAHGLRPARALIDGTPLNPGDLIAALG